MNMIVQLGRQNIFQYCPTSVCVIKIWILFTLEIEKLSENRNRCDNWLLLVKIVAVY